MFISVLGGTGGGGKPHGEVSAAEAAVQTNNVIIDRETAILQVVGGPAQVRSVFDIVGIPIAGSIVIYRIYVPHLACSIAALSGTRRT